MFKNIKDAIYWIENIKRKEKRKDLKRITKVLEDFGNPFNFTKIHVAGTNGKGSTCQILNKILQTKYKVGVFTSPYVVIFNERIKINDDYISDSDLLKYINEVYKYANEYETKNGDIIPFFELTFLISLLYFNDNNIDIAIIEVGVGGVLDCTNCLNYDVSLITNVSYDHMESLGDTIENIAEHKFGIMKNNNTVFTTIDESLHDQFNNYCNNKNINKNIINTKSIEIIDINLNETIFNYNNFQFKTSLIGLHQVYNSLLCIEVLNKFFNFSYIDINNILNQIEFNGRFEILCNSPLIVVDGAHNKAGIDSLVETIKLLFKDKVNLCFAAMKDKEVNEMVSKIEEIAKSISFTQLNYYRTNTIENFTSSLNNINYYENINKLMDVVKNSNKEEVYIFTGSLYFVSEIRKYFK